MNNKITTGMVLGAVSALIGILAVINPQGCIEAIVIVIGIAAILDGIASLVTIKELSLSGQYKWIIIAKNVIAIVLGALAVILPFAMFNTLQQVVRVFLYIQAVFLILFALADFIVVVRAGSSARALLTEAFISLCIAILLFLLPQNFGVYIVRIAGALLFVAGIVFVIVEWRRRPIEVEAEVIDVEDADAADETGAAAAPGADGAAPDADAASAASDADKTEA